MFQEPTQGAPVFTPQSELLPDHEYDSGRHLLLGSLKVVQATIKLLHKLNYAEPNDWSRPLVTGRPNEVMAILTRKVRID